MAQRRAERAAAGQGPKDASLEHVEALERQIDELRVRVAKGEALLAACQNSNTEMRIFVGLYFHISLIAKSMQNTHVTLSHVEFNILTPALGLTLPQRMLAPLWPKAMPWPPRPCRQMNSSSTPCPPAPRPRLRRVGRRVLGRG